MKTHIKKSDRKDRWIAKRDGVSPAMIDVIHKQDMRNGSCLQKPKPKLRSKAVCEAWSRMGHTVKRVKE